MSDLPKQITLPDAERQPCEVWTRVMGYHRPISAWNTGKKGEAAERTPFVEPAFSEGQVWGNCLTSQRARSPAR
jgi:hypothetical protein